MASLEKFVCYDELLYAPLQRYGWHAETVDWRNNSIDWNQFDAVVIRSCWDYQHDPAQFLTILATIERSSAKLDNSLDVVRWNLSKIYLRDLEAKGIPIVPTLWLHDLRRYNIGLLLPLFKHWQTPEIIIKPMVSACAEDTFRLDITTLTLYVQILEDTFRQRPCMVQPFIPAIVSEGEFSLFFFGDEYSHTILKTPKSGDFRVQEEHGGQLQSVQPEAILLELSRAALAAIPEPTLYARIDWVRTPNGFALMELELIEPSLYFNMDVASAERFARVFATRNR